MKLNNLKLDHHRNGWLIEALPSIGQFRSRHGFPQPTGLTTKIAKRLFENHPTNAKYLADNLYLGGENRAIVLLDYYDFHSKHEGRKWANVINKDSLKQLESSGYELHTDNKEAYFGVTKDRGKSWFYVIRGTEAPTLDGHFISAGIPKTLHFEKHHTKYRAGPPLEEKLKEAKDEDAIIIVPHPLTNFGPLAKALLWAVEDPSNNLGMQAVEIRNFTKYIDALESHSLSMSSEQTREAEKLAKQLDIPLVVGSDESISAGFNAYTKFDSPVDFSSPENLRASIRNNLQNKSFKLNISSQNPSITEKVMHLLTVGAYSRKDSA